jgi:hypothetical protein
MKIYLDVDVQIHVFLTSALVRGERLALLPGRFTPEDKRALGTHWKGGWVSPRAGLDDVEKILYSTRIRTPTPRTSSP